MQTGMEIKEILCYGDSNTWGTIPRWEESELPSERYDENTRWTKVAQKLLGEEYHLIEEGLGGRTTIYGSGADSWKTGNGFLRACLETHRQLDLVILMLGTNDLSRPEPPKEEVLGDGITELVKIVQENPKCGKNYETPKILVVSPIEIKPSAPNGRIKVYPMFHGDYGKMLSQKFPEVYEQVAKEYGCYFLNAALYAEPSNGDGVHFTPESHLRLGKAMAKKIQEIFA